MRLVTYDREGHRRLGAILEGEVIDLPDAVGHPVFPTTLEDLVSSSRGSVLDAARACLERDDVWQWRVRRPRLLTPLFPASLISPRSSETERILVGPEDDVPWPGDAAWVEHAPMLAAVLGNEASRASTDEVREGVFGYTLVSDWRARAEGGVAPVADENLPIAIGPWVVTADELDPHGMLIEVKVDGSPTLEGTVNGEAAGLLSMIAEASEHGVLERGDTFAIQLFSHRGNEPGQRLWPGAVVEVGAEGIGTLRNRLAPGGN